MHPCDGNFNFLHPMVPQICSWMAESVVNGWTISKGVSDLKACLDWWEDTATVVKIRIFVFLHKQNHSMYWLRSYYIQPKLFCEVAWSFSAAYYGRENSNIHSFFTIIQPGFKNLNYFKMSWFWSHHHIILWRCNWK